eukprot:1194427-Prorocentrum_minimum.AAC.2
MNNTVSTTASFQPTRYASPPPIQTDFKNSDHTDLYTVKRERDRQWEMAKHKGDAAPEGHEGHVPKRPAGGKPPARKTPLAENGKAESSFEQPRGWGCGSSFATAELCRMTTAGGWRRTARTSTSPHEDASTTPAPTPYVIPPRKVNDPNKQELNTPLSSTHAWHQLDKRFILSTRRLRTWERNALPSRSCARWVEPRAIARAIG